MRRNLFTEFQKYITKNRHRRAWRNIVIALACVVVFCTTYALILPAITVEQQDVNQVVGDTQYQEELKDEDDSNNTQIELGDGEINFKKYITDVTLQYKDNEWDDTWKDIEDNTVEEGDLLRFNIEYTLPGGILSYESPNIVYEIPAAIKIDKEENGDVCDSAGNKIGVYNISTDGKIKITFNEDYIKKNADGQQIDGYIAFKSSVENIAVDDKGQTKIEFNDTESVTIKIDSEIYKTGDIEVEKSASEVKNGEVTYIITVKSEKGTATTVKLSDIMEKLVYDGEFIIKDKDGNKLTNINTPESGSSQFEIELPQMNAGDEYTITYTAKFNEITNGTITGKNKVNVTSTDSNDNKLKSETEVTTNFTNEVIKKQGTLSEDKSKITWTITVNKSKQDISGYVLSDEKFEGEVEITPEGGQAEKINLPYTFPEGSNNTYIIKYTTDSQRNLGDGDNITNKATIKKDENDNGISDTGSVWVDGFNPLKKTAQSIVASDDLQTAIIKWNVVIDTKDGEIPAGWIYEDYLNGDQYFTKEQQNKLEEIIKNIDSNIEIEWYKTDNLDEVKGFKITFLDKLEKNQRIEFNYESTGSLGDGQSKKEFVNDGKIKSNDKIVYSKDKATYNPVPVVSKYDLKNNSTDNTSHNYDDITNGILGWGFKVTIPKNASGQNIIITEKLPEGVSLLENEGLKVLINDKSYIVTFDNEGKGVLVIDNYNINFTKKSDNTVIIEIPSELTVGTDNELKEYKFEIQVKIDEEYNWENKDNSYIGIFKNEVIVKGENDNELGKDDQTQTIKKEYTEDDKILKKTHQNTGDNNAEFENNIIPYSIVVNKEGKDLLEGSDTLTLKDVVKYQYYGEQYALSMSLVPDSVHIYNLNTDGTKGEELSLKEFKYTFVTESTNNDSGTITNIYTLSIDVPDSKPLIVEYKYKVNTNMESANINNIVSLEGNIDSSYESKDNLWIKISESSAGANIDGISIYKVDSDNNAILLPNAEFKLYRWDSEKEEYVAVESSNESNTFITDSYGKFNLKKLAYNTAYKLVEEEAPNGYLKQTTPYYFYILNSDKTKYPECKPKNFDGIQYVAGSVIYIENEIDSTKINVNKKWFKSDGEEVTGQTGSQISFELWQKTNKINEDTISPTSDSSTEYDTLATVGKIYGTYTINSTNDWTINIDDLPKEGTDSNGEKVYYTYYVKEIESTNYETSYENNEGISEGTITIKNRLKENPEYILPETGVLGGDKLFILGGMLLMAGCLIYIHKHKHKRGV